LAGKLLFNDGLVFGTEMKDEDKTKTELISELADLRRRLSEFEALKQEFEETNQRLRESEERFRGLVELSPYGIGIASDGVAVFINDAVATMLGAKKRSEIIGKPIMGFVHESSKPVATGHIRQVTVEGKPVIYSEEKFIRLDGELVDVEVTAIPFTYEGRPAIQAVFNDITARKKAEDQIKATLEEKEVLLREIHHRVKNNLQVISSLLRLHSRCAPDNESRRIFAECQNRLQSIGLIHELLYRSKNLAVIDFRAYINSLVVQLFYAYGITGSHISLKTEMVSAPMAINVAMPCGLIANELISNCLKHAFPNDRKGLITVSLVSSDDDYEFEISDDGVGLPDSVDVNGGRFLGLSLVDTLVKQLRGQIEVSRAQGTQFKLKFKGIKPVEEGPPQRTC